MNKFGWIPDLPDQRDYYFLQSVAPAPTVDLRPSFTPVYDQGNLGSCTANAIAAHLDFNRQKQHENPITPSRLFIYYNERKDQHRVQSDAGSTIRESVKAVTKYGACPESEWPYVISKFRSAAPRQAYADAVQYEALTYLRISRSLEQMKSCLSEGYPFVIGFSVYESFHQADHNGIVPLPAKSEQLLGGHAVVVVGYTADHWICRNSWGSAWGDHGYFYLPFNYLLDSHLSRDFWTLRTVK